MLALIRQRKRKSRISAILNEDKKIVREDLEIAEAFQRFYSALYNIDESDPDREKIRNG